jgi:hypothetical protein
MTDLNYSLINVVENIKSYCKSDYKFCYYCGETNQKKFLNTPHLIPQLLGPNNHTHNNECDSCNKFFSETYENDLQRFFLPFLITSFTKSGNTNKYPKYKPHSNSDFSIQVVRNKDGRCSIQVSNYDSDHNLVKINSNLGVSSIEIPRVGYIPINVYKSLLKIGIGLLPKDMHDLYSEYTNWLMDKDASLNYLPPIISTIFCFRTNNLKFETPTAALYEAKKLKLNKEEYIQHILILKCANIVLQLFFPPSKENLKIHRKNNQLVLCLDPLAINYLDYMKGATMQLFYYDFFDFNKYSNSETFYIKHDNVL